MLTPLTAAVKVASAAKHQREHHSRGGLVKTCADICLKVTKTTGMKRKETKIHQDIYIIFMSLTEHTLSVYTLTDLLEYIFCKVSFLLEHIILHSTVDKHMFYT